MDTALGDGTGVESCRVVIGFTNQRFSATAPLTALVATPGRLAFRARFGLGRFTGPWRLERSEVTRVFRAPGLISDCVAIQGSHDLDWRLCNFHL